MIDKLDFDILVLLLTLLFFIVGIVFPVLYFRFRKKLKLKWIFLVFKWRIPLYLLGLFALYLIVVYLVYANLAPRLISTFPKGGENLNSYSQAIEVSFNVPVVVSKLDPNINPGIKGEWIWEPYIGYKDLTRKGRFIPEETFFPDQRVVVYIVGVSRLLHNENHEMGMDFESIEYPNVVTTSPENGSESVTKDQLIEINLSNKNEYAVEYSFTIAPFLELEVSDIFDSKIIVKPKTPFTQDTEYKLTITKRAVRYSFKDDKIIEYKEGDETEELIFKTVKPPFIDEFKPSGLAARPDEKIQVKFSSHMNKDMVEEQFFIEPEIEGSFKWTDDLNMVFTPKELLPKETDFKVTFPAGLKNLQGGMFDEDVVYEFSTIGKIKIINVNPANGATSVGIDTIFRVTFDQAVGMESAQNRLRFSPNLNGTFSWDGNTMIFDPNNLSYSTNYTLTVLPGVQSLFGKDMEETFTSSFSVRSNYAMISGIPNLYQPQPSFSCNVYAAMMVMGWKGHYPSASQLIGEMGYNANQSNGVWSGNPYNEYVGNADGSWGYGVYWGPVQRVLSARGIQSDLKLNWNLAGAAQSVANGNPVVIWRYNGESADHDKDWVAADGTYVEGINGQHGGVITGFKGDVNNPSEIYLQDPWYGPGWYPAWLLDYYWSRMGRAALVIK